MRKVLLVTMPYGALERQALGLSLLKARLAEQGIRADVRYQTFPFAELIGEEEYYWLATDVPHTAFAGDWTFVEALYGPNPRADARYIREVLQDTWLLDATAIDRFLRVRSLVRPFLEYCLATVPWRACSTGSESGVAVHPAGTSIASLASSGRSPST